MRAAKAHDAAAEKSEEEGEGYEAKKNRTCAGLHRRAAAAHAVQASMEQDGDEDATMNSGQPQPRHPHTGQFQGKPEVAAKRGGSHDDFDDDDDSGNESDADRYAGDHDDIGNLCPMCDIPLQDGKCGDCGYTEPINNVSGPTEAIRAEAMRRITEAWERHWRTITANKKRKAKEEDDEDEADEDEESKDEECDDDDDDPNCNRRTTMNSRDHDLLLPPDTTRRMLALNAKAEGSNADLAGDDDSDYGYSRPGLGRESNYDAEQRTVHSVSEVFGAPVGESPNLFGAGMSEADRDSTNAARAGLGNDDGDQDDEGDSIGQGDRPPDSLDAGRRGIKTDARRPPLSRSGAGIRRVATNEQYDLNVPPTTAELVALNRQERRQQGRRYDRRSGRMVNNTSAPGDSFNLPSPTMID